MSDNPNEQLVTANHYEATTAASGKYMRCSKARSEKGMKLDVSESTRKN